MSGFVIDTPDGIRAFGYIQLFHKLKLEVLHPNDGMRWRQPPAKIIRNILAANGVKPERLKRELLIQYQGWLHEQGIEVS